MHDAAATNTQADHPAPTPPPSTPTACLRAYQDRLQNLRINPVTGLPDREEADGGDDAEAAEAAAAAAAGSKKNRKKKERIALMDPDDMYVVALLCCVFPAVHFLRPCAAQRSVFRKYS